MLIFSLNERHSERVIIMSEKALALINAQLAKAKEKASIGSNKAISTEHEATIGHSLLNTGFVQNGRYAMILSLVQIASIT